MPKYLALRIPHLEAFDVKLHADAIGAWRICHAEALHHHLAGVHCLATTVAGLSTTRTAPHARDVVVRETSIGKLALNQQREGGPIHAETSWRPTRCVLARFTEAWRRGYANPKAEVQAMASMQRSPQKRPLDVGPILSPPMTRQRGSHTSLCWQRGRLPPAPRCRHRDSRCKRPIPVSRITIGSIRNCSKASQNATTYCGQYQTAPRAGDHYEHADGSKTVVFESADRGSRAQPMTSNSGDEHGRDQDCAVPVWGPLINRGC